MAGRRLQAADKMLGPAVHETIGQLGLDAVDAAAVALARRYAALIDNAAPDAKYREPLRKLGAAIDPADTAALDALDRIRDALAEHSVASDLGPKLLAALSALGATPAARAARKGGTGAPIAGRLAAIRQARGTA